MSIYYTYLIGWTSLNRYYYGVRYSPNAHPSDLWKTYFTSSKHVKSFRSLHGEPDIIQVRQTFSSKDKAILWESRVLKRMKVRETDSWLNKNDCAAPPIMMGKDHPLYGIGHSPETIEKMRINGKGKGKGVPKSADHRRKISEARKRNWATNEALKKKLSEKNMGNTYGRARQGWIPSEETRKRMSEAAKNRKKGGL